MPDWALWVLLGLIAWSLLTALVLLRLSRAIDESDAEVDRELVESKPQAPPPEPALGLERRRASWSSTTTPACGCCFGRRWLLTSSRSRRPSPRKRRRKSRDSGLPPSSSSTLAYREWTGSRSAGS
jgi:hypothetical protein